MDIIDQIQELFDRNGHLPLEGSGDSALSLRTHALQCAQLAEWDEAAPSLVAAALLHDIGHLIPPLELPERGDGGHEWRALGLLAPAFDAPVLEPVRLHVQAKRWLATVDPSYVGRLSAGARRSLLLQGGLMNDEEREAFEAQPYSTTAVTLRRWDDRARRVGRRTPPLAYYLDIAALVRKPTRPLLELIRVGAADAV